MALHLPPEFQVSNPAYVEALKEARKNFAAAVAEKDLTERRLAEIEERIIQLRRVVVSLSDMVGEPTEISDLGITDATRTVMNNATTRMTLKQIKEGLSQLGFDLNTQQNADASVLAVLNRMLEKREIRRQIEARQGDRKMTWFLGPRVAGDNSPPLKAIDPSIDAMAKIFRKDK